MGDQAPTNDLKADLKLKIADVVDDIIEDANMLKEAVDMACKQLTKGRLDEIEKKLGKAPSYDLSDFFVDLLIATATSNIAFVALRMVSTHSMAFAKRALNTRKMSLKKGKDQVYEIASKFDVSDVTEMKIIYDKLHKKFDTSDVIEILKPGKENFDFWRVTAEMIEPASDAARQAARKLIEKSRKPQFTPGTDPGAMFSAAVFSFARKQRTTFNRIRNLEVNKIDKGEYSEDRLKDLKKMWSDQATTSSEDKDILMLKYANYYEAFIWVLLYGGYENMIKHSISWEGAGAGSYAPPEPGPDYWTVDKELLAHWLTHLIHPYGDGEETFREKATNDLLEKLGARRLPRSKPDIEQEIKTLEKYERTDPAQIDLKEYFKKLSENTEIIFADPESILRRVR
jgi:hypothetical protein